VAENVPGQEGSPLSQPFFKGVSGVGAGAVCNAAIASTGVTHVGGEGLTCHGEKWLIRREGARKTIEVWSALKKRGKSSECEKERTPSRGGK